MVDPGVPPVKQKGVGLAAVGGVAGACGAAKMGAHVGTKAGAVDCVALVFTGEIPSVVVVARSCARAAFSSSRVSARELRSSASGLVRTELVGVATAGSLLLPVLCLIVASHS